MNETQGGVWWDPERWEQEERNRHAILRSLGRPPRKPSGSGFEVLEIKRDLIRPLQDDAQEFWGELEALPAADSVLRIRQAKTLAEVAEEWATFIWPIRPRGRWGQAKKERRPR